MVIMHEMTLLIRTMHLQFFSPRFDVTEENSCASTESMDNNTLHEGARITVGVSDLLILGQLICIDQNN